VRAKNEHKTITSMFAKQTEKHSSKNQHRKKKMACLLEITDIMK
jgi:hypothetical protein